MNDCHVQQVAHLSIYCFLLSSIISSFLNVSKIAQNSSLSMKSNVNSHLIMAVFFCLFPLYLCAYPADHQQMMMPNYQQQNHENSYDYRRPVALNALSLNSQIVSAPKNISPCPRVFRYLYNGEEWEGRLRVDKPAPRGMPSFLRVEMSVGFKFNSVSCNETLSEINLMIFYFLFRNL